MADGQDLKKVFEKIAAPISCVFVCIHYVFDGELILY